LVTNIRTSNTVESDSARDIGSGWSGSGTLSAASGLHGPYVPPYLLVTTHQMLGSARQKPFTVNSRLRVTTGLSSVPPTSRGFVYVTTSSQPSVSGV